MNVQDIPCPQCEANAGDACVTPSGRKTAKPHQVRLQAIESKATAESNAGDGAIGQGISDLVTEWAQQSYQAGPTTLIQIQQMVAAAYPDVGDIAVGWMPPGVMPGTVQINWGDDPGDFVQVAIVEHTDS